MTDDDAEVIRQLRAQAATTRDVTRTVVDDLRVVLRIIDTQSGADAVVRDKAVAAELRRQADAIATIRGDAGWKDVDDSGEGDPSAFVRGTIDAMDEVADQLRVRADELDPP